MYEMVMVRLYPAKLARRPAKCPMAPPSSRPIPAKPQMVPMPGGAAMEDLLAEEREENLRRAAAHGPADRDHRDAHHQRDGAHVGEPFAVLVPGPDGSGSGRACGRGIRRASWMRDTAQAEKTKRDGVDDEGPAVSESRRAVSGEQGTGGERSPLGGLGQRIGGVQFVRGGDGGKNGGASAGEEGRGEHQQRR